MEVSSFRMMATFLLIINSNKEKFESFTIGEYFITQKTWSKNPVLLHYLWYRIGGINSPVLGHILGPFIIYNNSALFRARIRARKYLGSMKKLV